MTNIAIIGLGLMGASFAKKLTHLNYNVYGIDVSEQTIDKAKELKIIVDGSTNPLDVISKCDTFIFCLYPTKILPWIEVYQNDIPKHSLLMDISGVKTNIVKPIQDVLREDLELLSIHPMCGRESRGIEFSDETIFKGSNFILVPTQKNKNETVATFSVTIDMDNRLFNATTTFNIVGFGMYDGKYIIDKATHSISNGYRINIEAHKVVAE